MSDVSEIYSTSLHSDLLAQKTSFVYYLVCIKVKRGDQCRNLKNILTNSVLI